MERSDCSTPFTLSSCDASTTGSSSGSSHASLSLSADNGDRPSFGTPSRELAIARRGTTTMRRKNASRMSRQDSVAFSRPSLLHNPFSCFSVWGFVACGAASKLGVARPRWGALAFFRPRVFLWHFATGAVARLAEPHVLIGPTSRWFGASADAIKASEPELRFFFFAFFFEASEQGEIESAVRCESDRVGLVCERHRAARFFWLVV